MNIQDMIGKTCLISKINENAPIEAQVICLSEDGTKFHVRNNNGMTEWLPLNEYKLISSLSKFTLAEAFNTTTKLLFD